jgi:hypothetical protein
LAFAYYEQGNMQLALKFTKELLELDPEHLAAVGNKNYFEKALKNQTSEEKQKGCYIKSRLPKSLVRLD